MLVFRCTITLNFNQPTKEETNGQLSYCSIDHMTCKLLKNTFSTQYTLQGHKIKRGAFSGAFFPLYGCLIPVASSTSVSGDLQSLKNRIESNGREDDDDDDVGPDECHICSSTFSVSNKCSVVGRYPSRILLVAHVRRYIVLPRPLRRNNVRPHPRTHVARPCRSRDPPAQRHLPREEAGREAIGKVFAQGHSCVPVYSGNPKNIIGLLLVKSLLTVRAETETPVSAVSIRRIPRVPSDMPLYDILNEFQKGSSHMAAVVKAKGKNKNPQIVGDGEKSEEYKAASAETMLTTPLLSRLDEKLDTVVLDIEKETSRQVNANGPASLQQHEAVYSVGSRSIEDIEDGEVIGIITLEDVFEELLQEEIVDETDEYVDVHKRIRVAAAAAASSVARAPSYRRLTAQKGTQNRQGQQPFTPPRKPIDEELNSTKIQVSFVEPPAGNKR